MLSRSIGGHWEWSHSFNNWSIWFRSSKNCMPIWSEIQIKIGNAGSFCNVSLSIWYPIPKVTASVLFTLFSLPTSAFLGIVVALVVASTSYDIYCSWNNRKSYFQRNYFPTEIFFFSTKGSVVPDFFILHERQGLVCVWNGGWYHDQPNELLGWNSSHFNNMDCFAAYWPSN